MGLFHASHKGDFKNTIDKLKNLSNKFNTFDLRPYGEEGVRMLAEATPKDSQKTAESWGYEIKDTRKGKKLIFTNSNLTPEGTPIAILIQYGHATRSGTFVPANDFISPVAEKILEKLVNDINNRLTS